MMKRKFEKFLPALVPCLTEPCTICDIFVLIQNIVNFLLKNVIFPVAVIILMYGGIMWIIAGGDEQKIAKGKSAMTSAIWGIIIAFAAWLIVSEIIHVLVTGSFGWPAGIGKEGWKNIPTCPLSG